MKASSGWSLEGFGLACSRPSPIGGANANAQAPPFGRLLQTRFGFFSQRRESLRILERKLREDLTIDLDARSLKARH
jgi:hypothetical protein